MRGGLTATQPIQVLLHRIHRERNSADAEFKIGHYRRVKGAGWCWSPFRRCTLRQPDPHR
ncbi:MAG: hypothetical protein R2864_07915 [Syntrophotaleaceae bacterium]